MGDCPEGCDLHETDHGSPLRLCPDTSLLEILNITHARTFPHPTFTRLADSWTASRRHVAAAASLAQRHVDVSVVSFGPCHPARSSGTSGAPPRSVGSNPSPGGHPPGASGTRGAETPPGPPRMTSWTRVFRTPPEPPSGPPRTPKKQNVP